MNVVEIEGVNQRYGDVAVLQAESTPGQGTRVLATLPLLKSAES